MFGNVKKECEICGKPIYPPDVQTWAFKRPKRGDTNHNAYMFFCSWGCTRKWEAQHEKEIEEDDE